MHLVSINRRLTTPYNDIKLVAQSRLVASTFCSVALNLIYDPHASQPVNCLGGTVTVHSKCKITKRSEYTYKRVVCI